MDSFGKRLRVQRERASLTMGELSERSGVSKGHISELESGNAMRPSLDVAVALAGGLGISLGVLAFGEDGGRDPIAELAVLRAFERWRAKVFALQAIQTAIEATEHYGAHLEGGHFEQCLAAVRHLMAARGDTLRAWPDAISSVE